MPAFLCVNIAKGFLFLEYAQTNTTAEITAKIIASTNSVNEIVASANHGFGAAY